MKTTFLTLLRSIFNEKDAKTLNLQLNNLYQMNKSTVSYDLMLDIIQDTIVYNIQNNHSIEVANFKWKFKNKLLDYFKHKNIIEIVSLDEIKEKNPKKYETL